MAFTTTTLASSFLTLSIGLYFGVLFALFGLLVLAGTAGQWSLARNWLPALFEHSGTVFVLISLTLGLADLMFFGLTCMGWGHYHHLRQGAALNPRLELTLVGSALASVAVVAVLQMVG